MEQNRDGKGKFLESEESIKRDAEALRLKGRGRTLQEISDKLGYGGSGNAHNAIVRAVARHQKEPADVVYRMQMDNLDTMRRHVYDVLEQFHVVVQNGRIVFTPEADPVRDYKPVLEAVDRLLKIEDRFARLHGLDTVKLDVTVDNSTDKAIRTLLADFEAQVAAQEQELTNGG